MIKLVIAGTSIGGSAYMERICHSILDSNTATVQIIVTTGEKQKQVMAKVERCVATLNEIVEAQGGHPLSNVTIQAQR